MIWLKRLGWGAFIGLVLLLLFGFLIAPPLADRLLNSVQSPPPYRVPAAVKSEYLKYPFVADLHADALLWKRNLLEKNSRGHVDVPRMVESNIALQVFSIVTRAPLGQNEVKTDGNAFDQINLIAFLQRWPRRTWTSLLERTLYQTKKLHRFAKQSQGKLRIIKNRNDLEAYLKARKKTPKITAGLLAIEGAHALEGKLSNVDVVFKAGVRMIAATHFFDNRVGGSAHGTQKGGLTQLGKQMLKRMDTLKIIVDLAHCSAKVIEDTLQSTKRPVVVSHTGVRGTCPNMRNLTDQQIKMIAKNGGIIGLGLWEKAVCGKDAAATAKAMRYVADLVGVQHVSLGSDFDGSIKAAFDITGLPLLVQALKKEKFSTQDIQKILGGNFLRILRATLP